MQSKGDRFIINETEFYVVDAPKNKPACIEIKHKTGKSGKANLKIYHINGKGGATIHITKISRGDFEHVKVLAFKVVKFLLDNIISGNFESEDIEKMRIKSLSKTDRKKSNEKINSSCGVLCEEKFASTKQLNEHKETHMEGNGIKCDKCDKQFWKQEEFKQHKQNVHDELSSPNTKKMKLKSEGDKNDEEEYDMMEIDDPMMKISRLQDKRV